MPHPTKFGSQIRRTTGAEFDRNSTLEREKNLATIVSAIAIPIVLAISGYFVQRELSNEGLKKDYVGIAAGILKEDPSKQEPDLRTWAIKVLDDNSPVPFSKRAKEGLFTGAPIVLPGPAWLGPPVTCRKPVKSRTVTATLVKLSNDAAGMDKDTLLLRMQDFIGFVLKEESNAAEAVIRLKCLQDWVDAEEANDIEYRNRIGAPSSKSVYEQLQRERTASQPAAKGVETVRTPSLAGSAARAK